MTLALLTEQFLNGLQLGVMLFLMAAGLTLVLGIMNMVNLTHGSFYMIGAYVGAVVIQWSGSYLLGLAIAVGAVAAVGIVLEVFVMRPLYERDHLYQVLATLGLILFFNELTKIIWGPAPLFMDIPGWLSGSVELFPGAQYPIYRLAVLCAGILVALFLWWFISRTRLGMLIRAGATSRSMVGALGVNIELLFTLVFALGAALAGLAGMIAGPIYFIQIGMGDSMLIQVLVVIVIGGIGSVRGAFVASLIIGLADTFGRVIPQTLGWPAGISEMAVYALMAAILFKWPSGLFPVLRD